MSELEDPNETLDDVLSLCAKVLHDHEQTGRVSVLALLELRDNINEIRRHVANGGGYASIPRLIRPKDEGT
jgi:hypothetical protein